MNNTLFINTDSNMIWINFTFTTAYQQLDTDIALGNYLGIHLLRLILVAEP